MTKSQILVQIHVFINTVCNVLLTNYAVKFCQTVYIEWRCTGKRMEKDLSYKSKMFSENWGIAWGIMAIQQNESGCKKMQVSVKITFLQKV